MQIGISLSVCGKGRSGAATLWTPAVLGASLLAYWSADDHGTANMTDDGAGVISTWKDSVGALTTTAALTVRPTWAATSFNSAYAGVTFDGSNDRMNVASVGSLPVTTVASEIHALVDQTVAGATAGIKRLFAYGSGAANGARSLVRVPISNVNRLRVYDGTVTLMTDTIHDFSGPHIVGGRFSAATATAWFDGKATNPASAAMAFSTGTTGTTIGSTVSAAEFWTGVERYIFVTAVLSDANRQRLEGWMAHNSGLTGNLASDHPYKSAAPTV
jgi:hypothetical protein